MQLATASVSACTLPDFTIVKRLIAEMCLDDTALEYDQFITVKQANKVLGFGRLRTHAQCQELCSLGVTEDFRLKGIGRYLTAELIAKRQKPLYVVTVIPDFFSKAGFKITEKFPEEINTKLNYCRTSLSVPEPYVVMKLEL
ncbi:MAG: GNAT family N-acetyltransferase [Bacteroidia bacterium]